MEQERERGGKDFYLFRRYKFFPHTHTLIHKHKHIHLTHTHIYTYST